MEGAATGNAVAPAVQPVFDAGPMKMNMKQEDSKNSQSVVLGVTIAQSQGLYFIERGSQRAAGTQSPLGFLQIFGRAWISVG